MKTSGNTILINGGSAGIGFAMAKVFSLQNKIIITGRDQEKLDAASAALDNTTGIRCDITNESDLEFLVAQANRDFPALNVLINNAGKGNQYDLLAENINAFSLAQEEMLTNYLSVIRLNEKLIPTLKKQSASAIINVTSVAVLGANIKRATYGASKAALHSYTQSLRLLLDGSPIRVFELLPPLVNTDFSKNAGGSKGLLPEVVAEDMYKAFADDRFEVYVGAAEEFHKLYFADNTKGFLAINGKTVS